MQRPPVHARVIERAVKEGQRVGRVLDVGCGAGLSTAPLGRVAEHVIGMEPATAMLPLARRVAPDAVFVAGSGEALPVRSGSMDAITAAGSLNYLDLGQFFAEADRVLRPGGEILVYDFSPGRTFRGADALDRWFTEFERRYPWPEGEGSALSPEILDKAGGVFRVREHERFETGIRLDAEFYTGYMMTETNVARAVREGVPEAEIRRWCAETLGRVFGSEPKEVLFRGYFAWMARG